MSKTDFSNLQGLKYPSLLKAIANVEENYFITGWDIIKSEVLRISQLAWNADLNGDEEKASKYYKSVNIHFYLIHLNLAIVKEMSRLGISEITTELRAKYKLDCVEHNLTCLGINTNTPLYNTWTEVQDSITGEFAPCEFVTQEFTQTLGFNVNNCEELLTTQTIPVEIETNDGPDEVEVVVDSPVDRTPSNTEVYGLLYNWYAVDTGLLAPAGWRVPTDAEWTILSDYLIANGYNYDDTTIYNRIAKAMASSSGWESSSARGAVGNNDYPEKQNISNFTALPGGYRNSYGSSTGVGITTCWWSASIGLASSAWLRYVSYGIQDLYRYNYSTVRGFSVRCIRNLTVSEESLEDGVHLDNVTDIDGNVYKVVKIGTQAWMAENLKTTRYNNGIEIPNVTIGAAWGDLTTGAFCSYNNE